MNKIAFFIAMVFILLTSCESEEKVSAVYDPTPYSFVYPESFGDPGLPSDNTLTLEVYNWVRCCFMKSHCPKTENKLVPVATFRPPDFQIKINFL